MILRILCSVRTGTLPYLLLSYEWQTSARLSSPFSSYLPVLQRCGMVFQSRDGCAFMSVFEGGASEWVTGMLMQVREVCGAWHRFQEVSIKITSFFLAKTVNCYICSPFQLGALVLSSVGEVWTFSTSSQVPCSGKFKKMITVLQIMLWHHFQNIVTLSYWEKQILTMYFCSTRNKLYL